MTLENKLNVNGHLHVTLESGQEFGLSKHDVEVTNGRVIVDSKRGRWEFEEERIEFVDVEPSGPVE